MAENRSTSVNESGNSSLLRVQLLSPKGTLWEGDAESVSSVNSQGPFDLLPQHAHFITLVRHAPISIRTVGKGEQRFTFDSAVIRIMDDLVTIYADTEYAHLA